MCDLVAHNVARQTAQIEGDPKFDFKEWNFPAVVEKSTTLSCMHVRCKLTTYTVVARAILINAREKTVLVFFPSLEVKMVWKTLLDTTAQKRRSEKYERNRCDVTVCFYSTRTEVFLWEPTPR